MSGASKQANGQVSGPVLTSGFLAVLDHCEMEERCKEDGSSMDGVWRLESAVCDGARHCSLSPDFIDLGFYRYR